MKVSLREAINTDIWYGCSVEDFLDVDIAVISFIMRPLSLDIIRLDDVSMLQKYNLIEVVNEITLDEGVLAILGAEVVSAEKKAVDPSVVSSHIVLIDQDDCMYKTVAVSELSTTEFGKQMGIKRFSGWSDVPKLMPKIKATGALPFLLPYDSNAEYFLSAENDNFYEV